MTPNQEEHRQYLDSPDWKANEVRCAHWRQCVDESKGLCEDCHQKTATETHHKIYRGRNKERFGDLLCLCGDCHGKRHPEKREPTPRPQGTVAKVVEANFVHYYLLERGRELCFAGLSGSMLKAALRWLYENRCQTNPLTADCMIGDLAAWLEAHPPSYPLSPGDFIKLRYAAKDDLFKAAFDGQLLKFEGSRTKAEDYMIEVLAKSCACKFDQIERIISASTLCAKEKPLPDYSGIDF